MQQDKTSTLITGGQEAVGSSPATRTKKGSARADPFVLLFLRNVDGHCGAAFGAGADRKGPSAHQFQSFPHVGEADVRFFCVRLPIRLRRKSRAFARRGRQPGRWRATISRCCACATIPAVYKYIVRYMRSDPLRSQS